MLQQHTEQIRYGLTAFRSYPKNLSDELKQISLLQTRGAMQAVLMQSLLRLLHAM